jgi:pectinesterase
MKFVMRNCRFDGAMAFNLGRHFAHGHFYFLDCKFSRNMRDKPIRREIYSLNGAASADENTQRSAELDQQNILRERSYFHNCDRDGTDFNWFADNLSSAPGSRKPSQITAAWTFDGEWNPEDEAGPMIQQVRATADRIALGFTEPVTVKGKPRLIMCRNGTAEYVAGSSGDTLLFEPAPDSGDGVCSVDLNGGAIIACQASATPRLANISMPGRANSQQGVRANFRPLQIGGSEEETEL